MKTVGRSGAQLSRRGFLLGCVAAPSLPPRSNHALIKAAPGYAMALDMASGPDVTSIGVYDTLRQQIVDVFRIDNLPAATGPFTAREMLAHAAQWSATLDQAIERAVNFGSSATLSSRRHRALEKWAGHAEDDLRQPEGEGEQDPEDDDLMGLPAVR